MNELDARKQWQRQRAINKKICDRASTSDSYPRSSEANKSIYLHKKVTCVHVQ